MTLAYPSQRIQDWLSQQWVMMRGRRVEPRDIDWLMGPYGDVDVIGDHYVDRLAWQENLVVERLDSGAGLMESVDRFGLDGADRARLRPEVAWFYTRTADHDLEVWSEWNPFFCPFAGMLQRLYSRRLQQLNLPLRPLDTARGMQSQIIKLRDAATGVTRHTIWFRILKSTQQVVYSGVYSTCRIPDGRTCMKIVFPLPRGNATVIMSIAIGARGELDLVSSGEGFGSPGFYFLLRDARGRHWAQYIKSFRERITVFVDEEETLRTDHALTLWGWRVLNLHYRLNPRLTPRISPRIDPPITPGIDSKVI